MKREHDTWITNLHNTHCGCFSLPYICQPQSNLYLLSTFVMHSTEMSIRMLTNLYKSLTTNNKNGLRLVTNMLRMVTKLTCCEYAILANLRCMFLIFLTPQNRTRMLSKAYECLAIMLRSLRIDGEWYV